MSPSEVKLIVPPFDPFTADARLSEPPDADAFNLTVFPLIAPLFAKTIAFGALNANVPVVAFALDAPIVTVPDALSVTLTFPFVALALIPFAEIVRMLLLPMLPLLDVRLT